MLCADLPCLAENVQMKFILYELLVNKPKKVPPKNGIFGFFLEVFAINSNFSHPQT